MQLTTHRGAATSQRTPTDELFGVLAARARRSSSSETEPRASRHAHRAASPALVFNLHAQFEALRESGGFERMRDKIRERDGLLQGSINPMVSDHGEGS
jgi:FPC/CPF motif-containing protein YcgG